VLYESDESGRDEVYVQPYPGSGGRWQISESGGDQPRWGPEGRAVYFWSREGLVRREVRENAGALIPGASKTLDVARPLRRTAAVGKDGRILLVPFASEREDRARTLLVLDWASVLRRRLGNGR
jgi:hypothetical protein